MTEVKARRRFRSVLDELQYLEQRLMFWLYERMRPSRARPFAERMARLLRRVPDQKNTIIGSGRYALVAEARGRWGEFAEHTWRQLRLLDRLSKTRNGSRLVLPGFVIVTLESLGDAYIKVGDRPRALAAFARAKKLSRIHKIPFEREWLVEQANALPHPSKVTGARSRNARARGK